MRRNILQVRFGDEDRRVKEEEVEEVVVIRQVKLWAGPRG